MSFFGSILRAVALGGGMALAVQAASAQDNPSAVLDEIRASGELKIPVMVGEEPGYIKNPQTGEWSGFYVDFLADVAEQLGVSVTTVETTWGNLAADFQSNKIDVAIGVNPNPGRGLVVDYLWEPLFTDAWAILSPEGEKIETWAELNDPDKTVVVQRGSTMQIVAEALLPNATLTVVEDRNLAIMELQAGRADGILQSVFDVLQIANHVGGEVSVPEPMLRNPATLAVARKPGNAGYINFLTNWVQQQRSLGLAQGRLAKSWEDRGIDLSILPDSFSF